MSDATQQLATKALRRSPFQKERKPTPELIGSVKQHGIIQPLVVRPIAQANGRTHEIIAGERRWGAAIAAGLENVPVIVREASDTEARELQTSENLQRAAYNPIEEAEAYHGLIEDYKTHGIEGEKAIARLCEKVGKARSTVYERLSLLRLPDEVKELADTGELDGSQLGIIVGYEGDQAQLARRLAGKSFRESKAIVPRKRRGKAQKPIPDKASTAAAAPVEWAENLSDWLLRVEEKLGEPWRVRLEPIFKLYRRRWQTGHARVRASGRRKATKS